VLFFGPEGTEYIFGQFYLEIGLFIDGDALDGVQFLDEAGRDEEGVEFHACAVVEGDIRVVLLRAGGGTLLMMR
jgi:hypothetical protein